MAETAASANLYFDRDITLSELLKVNDGERLRGLLTTLLGDDVRLITPAGQVIFGAHDAQAGAVRAPVRLELEPIGYLETTRPQGLKVAVAAMEMLTLAAARYYMASALQMESVQQDYLELQEKNAALQASEERYRLLAESLEQRVANQVQTIETRQRQLYQTERLASVGQLAAGVAHEINNPIGFIKSNLATAATYVHKLQAFGDALKAGAGGEPPQAAWAHADLDYTLQDFAALIAESADGAQRVAQIVADLKGFSNIDRTDEERVDVNETIRSACNVAAGQIKDCAELSLRLGQLPFTRCRPGHLSQVWLGLLLNAAQAMAQVPEQGAITVETSFRDGTIMVVVSDNGCGIPETQLAHIFDPFFTTRAVGQGTGLGLTVARDIVTAHGGHINVESAPGRGTTFTIQLPERH